MLLAVLPAHNEAEGIVAAIEGLRTQERPPDDILVVCDNCTDNTAELAEAAGARVMHTVGNQAKKAGALNQAFQVVLRQADRILVMDADSVLDPAFLRTADEYIDGGKYVAIGGTFRGGPGGGFVGWCQRNEYARYERDVRRLNGTALVLTGTATVFQTDVLRKVAALRGTMLPGEKGKVYDEEVLTEDNELTFALRHLGYKFLCPPACTLETEIMPTWGELAKQRLRWKRGAIENLIQYGFPSWAWPFWGRQALSAIGILMTFTYLTTFAFALIVGLHIRPLWVGVTAVFALHQVVTVRSRGWRAMLVGALIYPEMMYDVFLQAVQGRAFLQAIRRTERGW